MERLIGGKKAAIKKIYEGYGIILERKENNMLDWDIKESGGDVWNCKTLSEAESVLIHIITVFQENEVLHNE